MGGNGGPAAGTLARSSYWKYGLGLRVPFTSLGPSLLWDAMSLLVPQFEHAFLGMVPYPKLTSKELSTHSLGRATVVWLAFIHPITIALVGGWPVVVRGPHTALG